MMPYEKRTSLIAKLIEMTRNNEIHWTVNGQPGDTVALRSSPFGSYVYEASVDGIKFSITKSKNSRVGVVMVLSDADAELDREVLTAYEYPILYNLYEFASKWTGDFERKIDSFLGR